MTIEEVLTNMEEENYEIKIDNGIKNKKENNLEMNIFQKLTYIQNDLLEIPIPKNGKNPFGNFKYYELEDLLPPILKLCKTYGCTLFFDFPITDGECEKGVLNLINWIDKEDCIKVTVPFPKLEKLPKMNYAQSSGTYQTYMKRYLILHTFDIVEKEIIDSGLLEEENKKQEKKSIKQKPQSAVKQQPKPINKNSKITEKKEESVVNEKPEVLKKVEAKCHELYGGEECTGKLLNKVSLQMFNKKEITLDERKEIFEYIKTMKKK